MSGIKRNRERVMVIVLLLVLGPLGQARAEPPRQQATTWLGRARLSFMRRHPGLASHFIGGSRRAHKGRDKRWLTRGTAVLLAASILAPTVGTAGGFTGGAVNAPTEVSKTLYPIKPYREVAPKVAEKMITWMNRVDDRALAWAAKNHPGENWAHSVPLLLYALSPYVVGSTEASVRENLMKPLGADTIMTPAEFIHGVQTVVRHIDSTPGVKQALAVFLKSSPYPAYRKAVTEGLNAEVADLGQTSVAEATRAVNRFIETSTTVKDGGTVVLPGIKDLVGPRLVRESDILSVAALAAHGKYREMFSPTRTKQEPFHTANGTGKGMQMRGTRSVYFAREGDVHSAALVAKNGLVDWIVVPSADLSTPARVAAFEKVLTTRPADFQRRMADIWLPRTSLSAHGDPVALMKGLGIDPAKIDLVNIDGDPGLKIKRGVMQTALRRNEAGIAGQSGVAIGGSRGVGPVPEVKVRTDVGHITGISTPDGIPLISAVVNDIANDPGPARADGF
jgi:hypothetical protein